MVMLRCFSCHSQLLSNTRLGNQQVTGGKKTDTTKSSFASGARYVAWHGVRIELRSDSVTICKALLELHVCLPVVLHPT